MQANSYQEFHKRIFQKKNSQAKENILVFERASYLRNVYSWGKEFAMLGEHYGQQTFIFTGSKTINWKWLPKILKKSNDEVIIDHSKSSKTPQFIHFTEIASKDELNDIFSQIQESHDNMLEGRDDNRLFRLIIDDPRLLDHQFLRNLMVFSRKTNLSMMMVLDLQENTNLDPFFIYFDKVIELGEIDDNIANTAGTAKILKFKEMEAFSVSEGVSYGPQKVFFWGFEKYNNLSFRDIDITEVI